LSVRRLVGRALALAGALAVDGGRAVRAARDEADRAAVVCVGAADRGLDPRNRTDCGAMDTLSPAHNERRWRPLGIERRVSRPMETRRLLH